MNIHEYQAKELLAKFGVPVPAGYAAMNVEEAVAAAAKLPGPLYVVKAQIHAGGRGKGRFKELGADAKGGVRLAKSIDEVEANAREMLGNTLVTVQTGEHGKQVNRLYITDGVDIASEFYLSLLVDRDSGRVAYVVSTEGGMDIEGVAHDTPDKITTFTVDPAEGFQPHHGRAVAFALKLTGDLNKQAPALSKQLYDAFLATDCSMLEINPLVVTEDQKLIVLDAKMSFDSNALYRHKDIEGVAHDTPKKITTFTVDPAEGFQPHHGRAVAFALKLTGDLNKQAQALSKQLYDAFLATDCSMLEINPLVVTEDGKLMVLDAKMSFDSNALYRHKDVEALRDTTEEDPAEVEASEYDLAYIKLDGNIGCMVNGAGLAMATMDIIKLNGAFPANFLDVGGGASKEKVTAAFKIILKDPAVEGILVNIFGGIMKCDVIADGIVAAAKEVNLSVPLVVRLEGTNVAKGKEILENSGLPIVSADDLGDAARKIVAEVKQAA